MDGMGWLLAGLMGRAILGRCLSPAYEAFFPLCTY